MTLYGLNLEKLIQEEIESKILKETHSKIQNQPLDRPK